MPDMPDRDRHRKDEVPPWLRRAFRNLPTAEQLAQLSESMRLKPTAEQFAQLSESMRLKPTAEQFAQLSESMRLKPTAEQLAQLNESIRPVLPALTAWSTVLAGVVSDDVMGMSSSI